MNTVTEASEAGRSTREDWLRLAIRTLIDEGIDQVKVQVLARELGVSRSSFYWFFESLPDLHKQLLEHWLRINTGPIIERALRPAPHIIRAILNVFECWVDDHLFDPKLDMAVRLWARRSETVRAVVEQADSQRVDAIAAMYRRHGYEEGEAFIRARVLYFTQIGQYALLIDESLEVRHSRLGHYLKCFSGLEPEESDIADFYRFTFGRPPERPSGS
ncbi:TetR/AcrR family transcriptional regulator [Rhizobium alvei]|uniref:TetR/AcrR family transcriptional regulator n=1 Tax=Rhizobium alvei TaxID=1132659 RepID=A0ABT8YGC9_9HYPH|nr:TetR/AcrR family transcriptional regulator [Rhizobium alvei]MDO6962512.1 TetR/AcrR family transcriptional regulator [Rhizobium alvei]